MSYLSKKDLDYLEKLSNDLNLAFISFEKYHHTSLGNINGIVFKCFNDKVLIWMSISYEDTVFVEFSHDFYDKPENATCFASSYVVPKNIDKIKSFIYDFYFNGILLYLLTSPSKSEMDECDDNDYYVCPKMKGS